LRSWLHVALLRGLALCLVRCCCVGDDFRWVAHHCEPFAEAWVPQHCCATCCYIGCAPCLPCPYLAFVAQGRAASLVTLLTDLPVVVSVSTAGSGAVRASASCRAARAVADQLQAALQDGRVFVAVPRPSRVFAADAALAALGEVRRFLELHVSCALASLPHACKCRGARKDTRRGMTALRADQCRLFDCCDLAAQPLVSVCLLLVPALCKWAVTAARVRDALLVVCCSCGVLSCFAFGAPGFCVHRACLCSLVCQLIRPFACPVSFVL
jgi:hypothetical protein